MDQTIKVIEKILLVIIAVATIFATGQEIFALIENRSVQLADLLLLFIYTEVLGMVGVFYKSNKIPITLPLFIAITALSRMIILQGKGSEPQNLIYESAAVLLLALSCLIIRQPSISSLFNKNSSDKDT
jgi:protein PsiE